MRGLAILLVMYGHCIKDMQEFFVFTSPVKMPLFFAITGYVFKANGGAEFANQLVRKVVVPWLLLGLLPSVFLIPYKGVNNVFGVFLDMMSGKVLWFFPCFIIGEIIHYVIRRFCSTPVWIVFFSFVCFALGFVLNHNNILDYAMFNRALTVQPFFLIGYLFRIHENRLTSLKWSLIVVASITYLGLCFLSMALFPEKTIDVHLGRYYNIPYCLLLIFLGCFLLFTAGAKANFCSKIMSFIGQNTILLYIWHLPLIFILEKTYEIIGWSLPLSWWAAVIKVIWACLSCGLIAIYINRFIPEMVGKKRL